MQSENDPRTCLSAAPHETVASKGSIQERFPGSAARRNCQECRDDLACMSNPKCKVRMTADAPTPAPTFEALLQDYADWIGANAGLKSPDIVAERKARAAVLAAMTGPQWQDIRTAPRDGTRILVVFRHENFAYAKTDAERAEWQSACEAYWTDFNGGGWVWNGIAGVPICWQFLPTGPLAAAPEGGP